MSQQTHLEIFKSEYHMLQFFGKYLEKLDVNTSARLGAFLYSYDGKLVLARSLYEFLEQMEKMTALGIDIRASTQKGASFLVFFKGQLKDPERFRREVGKVEALKEAIVAETKSKAMESAILVNTQVEVKEVTEAKVEDVKSESGLSEVEKQALIAAALELKDDSKKAASKSALEAFALEHGISLSKGKTFDAMIEDFTAAL